MSDDQTQHGQAATGVFIPPTVRDSHGELVDLILKSESMNDEERQYWIDILPIMTPDQIEQLRTILVNERDQLAAIDAKYAKNAEPASSSATRPVAEIGEERRERAKERSSQEHELEASEAKAEEEILKQVEDL